MNWYSEVFDLVFPGINPEQANNVWKSQLEAKKDASKDSNDVPKDAKKSEADSDKKT